MSLRALVITLLGIACGFLSAFGVMKMNNASESSAAAAAAPKVAIVVAKTAIERGMAITPESLEMRDWPEELLPSGSLTSMEQATGRVAGGKIVPGEPVLDAKLAAMGAHKGAGNLVTLGMRAYTIVTNNPASSVAGLILPSDRVDVILTVSSSSNDKTGGGTSSTLLQNVEILAIDKLLEAPERASSESLTSVTVLVTQRQASLLGLGQKMGTLTMSLRNPEDNNTAETAPVTLAELRVREEPAAKENFWTFASHLADAVQGLKFELPPTPPAEAAPALQDIARKQPVVKGIRTVRGSQSGMVSVWLDADGS